MNHQGTIAMTLNLLDFDPNRLAAINYRPEDDADTLLAGFAADLSRAGERIGGEKCDHRSFRCLKHRECRIVYPREERADPTGKSAKTCPAPWRKIF